MKIRISSGKRSAFTIMELMVSMLSAAVLALLVGSILVFSYMAWKRNNQVVEIQRDASLAMDTIGRLIREAKDGEVRFPEGGSVLYFDPSGATNVAVVGSQLVLNPGGMALVRNGVLNFDANDNRYSGSWDVVLQLFDPESGSDILMEGTYTPRNR